MYAINRLPLTEISLTDVYTINYSPYEWLFRVSLDLSQLKVFGFVFFILLHPYDQKKLQPHSSFCSFLG